MLRFSTLRERDAKRGFSSRSRHSTHPALYTSHAHRALSPETLLFWTPSDTAARRSNPWTCFPRRLTSNPSHSYIDASSLFSLAKIFDFEYLFIITFLED